MLARLPAGYRALFDRAVEVFASESHVRGMWLSGSLARGTADVASDLDVLVAVDDEHYDEFATSWRAWLEAITPTVLAEELPFAKGSSWSVTPGFERFDVVVERASDIESTFFRTRLAVFDHDRLTARMPPASPGAGPNPDKVRSLVEQWFHFSAMLETILVRQDWLLADEHLHFLSGLVYQLFVEANAPTPAMGVKQWSAKLSDVQRETMLALPRSARSVPELVTAHLALSRAFIDTAGPLADALGVPWPDALAEAATAHLRDVLHIEEPYPSG